MNFSFASILEQLRARLPRRKTEARLPGVPPLPGTSLTRIGGRLATFRFPRVDWEKLYRKSFVYNSAAALVCGYFAADLLVASLSPWFPPVEAPRPRFNFNGDRHDFLAYSAIILPPHHPNLFNEKGLVPDNDEGAGNLNGPPVKSSLPLNLLGVIVVSDPKKSVASVEDKGQNQVIAVRIGEPISANTVVQSIEEDRVVFINNNTNRREYIELPQDVATLQVHRAPKVSADGVTVEAGGHVRIASDAMKTALGADFGKIITQALCRPEMDNGKPIGYRCSEIEKGSVYEKLGLQNGDVVTSMDGEPLTNMAPLMQKLNELREGRVQKLTITLLRNGQPSTTYFDLD